MDDGKSYSCDLAKVVGSPAQGVMEVGLTLRGGIRKEDTATAWPRIGVMGSPVGVGYGGIGWEEINLEAASLAAACCFLLRFPELP